MEWEPGEPPDWVAAPFTQLFQWLRADATRIASQVVEYKIVTSGPSDATRWARFNEFVDLHANVMSCECFTPGWCPPPPQLTQSPRH